MAKITTVTFRNCKEATTLRGKVTRGAKHLGSGAFAATYLSKSGRVIKIGGMNDSYIEYAKQVIAAKGSKNPFLPKIYSLTFYRAAKTATFEASYREFYVVEMERLYELHEKHDNNICTIVSMFENILEYDRTFDNEVKGQVRSVAIPGIYAAKVKVDPKAAGYFRHLKTLVNKAIRKAECGWDIHEGNIMARRNGQLVVTDPIA